jgi:hypothetical protein
MNRLLVIAVFGMLLVPSIALSQERTFSGEIMDNQCAKVGSHDKMMEQEGAKSSRECTTHCIKAGAKYVLYDPGTKTVYQLDDQKAPEEFAGQTVNVSGTLDDATKTIHISHIKAAS